MHILSQWGSGYSLRFCNFAHTQTTLWVARIQIIPKEIPHPTPSKYWRGQTEGPKQYTQMPTVKILPQRIWDCGFLGRRYSITVHYKQGDLTTPMVPGKAFASTQWAGAPGKANKDFSLATTLPYCHHSNYNKQLLGFRTGQALLSIKPSLPYSSCG